MDHLSREQTANLLRAAKRARERDWALFLVTFWHGLRASEAIALTPANFTIAPDGIYLEVKRLKGSNRTLHPLIEDDDELLNESKALRRYLATHAARYDDWRERRLFPISRVQFFRLMRRYGREAGLPRALCHPHVLKHSIAKQTIAAAGIDAVKQYLGHRDIRSTAHYLRSDDAEASAAIAAAARSREKYLQIPLDKSCG